MKFRRCLLALGVLASLCPPFASQAAAEFPEKPIHLVVGYGPGGAGDLVARLVAKSLSAQIGQPVVVENRPGADTSLAADYVARAKPDGYTLFLYGLALTRVDQSKVQFDIIKSFSPMLLLAEQPGVVVVNSASPAKTIQEFVTLAKSKPGQLNFGSTGPDTPSTLTMNIVMKATGIDLINIPYKDEQAILVGLLGNEVQAAFITFSTVTPTIKAGAIRPLAISTKTRFELAPDIPTIADSANVPDFDIAGWYGIAGPAGVPTAVVTKLHDALATAIASAEFKQFASDNGLGILGGSSQDLATKMTKEVARWAPK